MDTKLMDVHINYNFKQGDFNRTKTHVERGLTLSQAHDFISFCLRAAIIFEDLHITKIMID